MGYLCTLIQTYVGLIFSQFYSFLFLDFSDLLHKDRLYLWLSYTLWISRQNVNHLIVALLNASHSDSEQLAFLYVGFGHFQKYLIRAPPLLFIAFGSQMVSFCFVNLYCFDCLFEIVVSRWIKSWFLFNEIAYSLPHHFTDHHANFKIYIPHLIQSMNIHCLNNFIFTCGSTFKSGYSPLLAFSIISNNSAVFFLMT